jgi:hypothetical protein
MGEIPAFPTIVAYVVGWAIGLDGLLLKGCEHEWYPFKGLTRVVLGVSLPSNVSLGWEAGVCSGEALPCSGPLSAGHSLQIKFRKLPLR